MMRRIEDRSKKRDKFIDDDDYVGDNHEAQAQGYSPATSKAAASTDDCAE
jgi:hypothetical protein